MGQDHTGPTSACAEDADGPAGLGVARQADSSGWVVLPGAGDFNRDNLADVLWGKPGKSVAAIWLLSGSRLLAPGPVIPGPNGDGWNAVTSADFDGDGMVDVLWSDDAKGKMAVSLMDGARVNRLGPEIPGPSGPGWSAVNASDFNGDGMADVLWHNATTHSMAVWLMAGAVLLRAGPVIPAPSGDGWVAANTVDFNQDGMSDILWGNQDVNAMSVWLMSGVHLLAPGPLIQGPDGGGWTASTAVDFNRDGMADVLWTDDAKGKMAVWLMMGVHVLDRGREVLGPGLGWTAAAAADCNGDGMADVIWDDTATNQMAVWQMKGTHLLLEGAGIPGPAGY